MLFTTPQIEAGERLFVYLNISEDTIKPSIMVGVAVNDEDKKLLVRVKEFLSASETMDHYIILHGKRITGRWNEDLTGVHFEVYAIEFWYEPMQDYRIIIATYEKNFIEMMRHIEWGQAAEDMSKFILKRVF